MTKESDKRKLHKKVIRKAKGPLEKKSSGWIHISRIQPELFIAIARVRSAIMAYGLHCPIRAEDLEDLLDQISGVEDVEV